MSYVVYEENNVAELYEVGLGYARKGIWSNGKFSTKRAAEVYAYLWCHKVTYPTAVEVAPEMELGVKYDYSSGGLTFGNPIMMSILEIED